MYSLSVLPVYDGTQVKADILKRPRRALLHRVEIGQLVVH